mmetsp:Transcript_2511/g.3766  ORF Transcript_2511/g.3766 Transcript_2511/m.3766 type:complete len:550 (+) Transcript_2511:20-1669(+)
MASATIADRPRLWRSMLLFTALVCCSIVLCMHEKLIVFSHAEDQEQVTAERTKPMMRRRLSDDVNHDMDLEHVLHLATRTAEDTFTEDPSPFRVLFIVTTLSEYDKGTRGTVNGADRLKDLVLPLLVDGVESMVHRGWSVDVYLICGFEELKESRRQMIQDALPTGVGLEVWDDAIPYYYVKKFNQQLKRPDQTIEFAPHGLSRQHRFLVRDKLMEYDFFVAFEDDIRVTADHVVNFLEMSTQIDRMRRAAEHSSDGKARVEDALEDSRTVRGKSMDKATVGNDLVQDPMTADDLRRLWPGFIRAEVVDNRGEQPHPLLEGSPPALDNFKWKQFVPASMEYEQSFGTVDPNVCCDLDSPRTPTNPTKDDLVLWETDISATGVRHYPGEIGWAAAMPVEDKADVGSYWSGEGNAYNDPSFKRPRRVDALLGQQAGWMATRSQVLYFHEHACPGGFLPHFDGKDWYSDSLQTRNGAVEFWSGGFQLFGRCRLNRILSLDPKRFSRQILYHSSNNKQKTKTRDKFIRLSHFLGQLYTAKERALKSLQGETTQ